MTSLIKTRSGSIGLGKIHPEDDALELMYFGSRGMTRRADEYLATLGLSRVHHRILYTIARGGGMTVTDLLAVLSVSKQALHRPMKQLVEQGYVAISRDPARHRFKILNLTARGKKVEERASEFERQVMKRAFIKVGEAGQKAWKAVMAEAATEL
jgi:DNA-binding MarR family transcriptional regulator